MEGYMESKYKEIPSEIDVLITHPLGNLYNIEANIF